jgi:hypothetical protein
MEFIKGQLLARKPHRFVEWQWWDYSDIPKRCRECGEHAQTDESLGHA